MTAPIDTGPDNALQMLISTYHRTGRPRSTGDVSLGVEALCAVGFLLSDIAHSLREITAELTELKMQRDRWATEVLDMLRTASSTEAGE